MSRSKYSSGELSSYLLETMDDAQRRYLERRMFEDDDLALDLFDAEEELIEKYHAGLLDSETKDLFEKIYNKTGSQKAVLQLYRTLSSKSRSPQVEVGTPPRMSARFAIVSLAFLLIVLSGLVAFLMNHEYKLEANLRESRQEATLSQRLLLKSRQAKNSVGFGAAATGTIQTAVLSSRVFRESADSSNTVEILSTTDILVLKLDLEKASPAAYQVKLLTVDNELVYFSGPIASSNESGRPILTFPLPISQIQPGDYLIELNIQTTSTHPGPAAEYYLRLRKK